MNPLLLIPLHIGLLLAIAYFLGGMLFGRLVDKIIPNTHKIRPAYGYDIAFVAWISTLILYVSRSYISYWMFGEVWRQGYWNFSWYTLFYTGMAAFYMCARPKNTSAKNLLDP